MSVHVEDINTEAVVDSVISSLRTLDCALGDLKESGLVKGGGEGVSDANYAELKERIDGWDVSEEVSDYMRDDFSISDHIDPNDIVNDGLNLSDHDLLTESEVDEKIEEKINERNETTEDDLRRIVLEVLAECRIVNADEDMKVHPAFEKKEVVKL